MSFFYDLNKKLNGLRAEDKQITESVAKAAAEVKTPARVTLEESLKQDMKSLMEGSKPDFLDMDKDGNKKEPMKKAVADKKKNPFGNKKVNEGSMKDAMWHDAERMSREQFCAKWGDENCEFWDNISGELDEATLSTNSAPDFDPQPGDIISDTVFGKVKLLKVTERDTYGQFAAGVVKTKDGRTLNATYEQLIGNDEVAEGSSKNKNLVKYSVFYDLVDNPKTGKTDKVYSVVKLEAKPEQPNFYGENPKTVKKGILKQAEAQALADKLNSQVKEDGTGGANFSGSGSLEEKAGYSAKKAAAGKDIGKPGKNFAKIEKSAGGGEKGKRIAGAVLAKLRAAKESVEEASMEMEAGAGGIHGSMPDPMSQKDQQRKMNPPRSLEETDKDIMEFLRSKLGHAEPHAYNAGSGKPDAHNGMEFEGNAFTGKLASTPKGGEFSVGDKEFTDTSSLEEAVSRKHFQQVADLLRNIPDEAKRKEMALHHASIFSKQNPRFDMRRFGQACGVDLEECAMWEELKGGQHKLDVDHDGDIGSDDLADLRAGQEVTDEGFADMDAWLAQREKAKGTGKFDSRKVSTGTVYTRKPETFGGEEGDDTGEPAVKRGRGRPAVAKKPERVTGKAWKHKGGRMQEEGAEETVDEEKAEAGKRHFFDKLAPAAKKVAKVVSKVAGEKKTEKEDSKAERAGKKVAKDIEHDEGNKAKDDNKAEKAGKKVTKDIEYDDKKDKKEKKADKKKEEKVDETTTSGSVATASTGSKGGVVGQGIYDSIEREFERLLAESVSVTQEAIMDENAEGGEAESITITATGDDVAKLKAALQSMGIGQPAPAEEPHSDEACHSCGGVPCQCDELGATDGLPGEMEIEVVEADAPVSQNSPDYPTNQECSDDALQYSGGLNKPKATGQSTVPVLASQEERQVAESNSFYSLVKAILVK